MSYYRNKLEFNGYLHSLRYICDKESVDYFTITNECDLNRVQKLYNSNLHGSNYILSLLWSESFEKDMLELISKNRGTFEKKRNYEEDKYILLKRLEQARYTFCGIGTRKIKTFLNRRVEYDNISKILRLALEIEECNISAKNSYGEFLKYRYYEKQNLIEELIDICEIEKLNYGYKTSDVPTIRAVIFFDLYGKQISWHTNCDKYSDKIYDGEWDGIVNSNLLKIEEVIMENHKEEIEKYEIQKLSKKDTSAYVSLY